MSARIFLSWESTHDEPITFLVIFLVIGCFISVDQERTARYTFLRENELKRAREETECKSAELLLLKEKSRLMAERQNQEKSKFIAAAAHDIRNAMQPIGNFLEAGLSALSRDAKHDASVHLKEAKYANQAMRTAVNAMLDISELESGIIKIDYQHFDVSLLAAEILKHNELLAQQHTVKLRLSRNCGIPAIVYSDQNHLRRVLVNLVTNGIKYADLSNNKSPTVSVAIVSRGKTIRLAVVDNGIGIPSNLHEEVLKPLIQLHNPERNREKGVGLGLSIVNNTLNLLSEHRFRLSSKPGLGTRFTLTLPKGNPLAVDETSPRLATDCVLDGMYVLLVENDLGVKKSMLALFQENGAEYEAVSSLDELLVLLPKVMEERNFDVVVSDYRLPDDHTALDVFATLNTFYGEDLPGLVITGETADLSNIVQLKDKKILRKPVDAQELLTEVNRLCQKSVGV